MAGLWPLRLRSLHADFCAGERVMGVNQNISGLRRDDRDLTNATKVLTRRFLRWRTRYDKTKSPSCREYWYTVCGF
ncbi:hypothetical protein EFO71_13355 [Lacticaseibacillus rhamnosus]|nr:hypothetical protein [Lacticaseibacillus rhamnosus]MCT3179879.1 hypothetical protein [Lacticaseibacillus rhamnosus]MCT3185169.1 hypothetical protein [Lacticaseibacillus rhamnosus]MCT4450105.1 hypothetical protein [Lacticaseibacillus rhamnosus]